MDGGLTTEFLPSTVIGLVAVAIGALFPFVQQRSVATLGLAGTWIGGGAAMVIGPPFVDAGGGALQSTLVGATMSVGLASSATYLWGLVRTAKGSARLAILIRTAVRVGWGLSCLVLVLAASMPAALLDDYANSLGEPEVWQHTGFWVFASFWALVAVVYGSAWALLARMQLDLGERVRANSSALAVPLLVLATALPYRLAVAALSLALVTMLYGLFRFHAAQGERSAFLSRFLSPQVAEQVRTEGLTSVMEPAELDLTVVACDLRGFTSYAEAVPSQAVIDLLGEFYDAVGEAVTAVDGTIKDYAGDGILVLVGAPLPRGDHASAGLALARRIHEVTQPVLERWSTGPHPLGIGVGAATGRVTVGAIGSSGRMEYTAVGVPVNLAARLCSRAEAGETLVDPALAEAIGSAGLRPCEPARLKGFSAEVAAFTLT